MKVKVLYARHITVRSGDVESFDSDAQARFPWTRVSFSEIDSAPGTWAVVVEAATEWNRCPGCAGEAAPEWKQVAWLVPLSGIGGKDEYERSLAGFLDRIEVDGKVWWDSSEATER